MYSFLNDYSEGAHPKVLEALMKTNDKQSVGYGCDEYCQQAKEDILRRIERDADVHFLVGGTQTNMTFISFVLRDYQAVIACDEGHINVHETGAVESTGHKVLTVPHVNGKLTVEGIDSIMKKNTDEHMVQPAMVYISQTTELGTYYTKEELKALYEYTSTHELYLFIDGARLGSALVLDDAPTLKEMALYSDAFYIGGTKMGALFGEALVIINKDLQKDFRYEMKQKGGMLAKGRLLGVQFHALLKDNTYEEIGRYENHLAMKIKEGFVQNGYSVYLPSLTNQVFVDLPLTTLHELEKDFLITHMNLLDDSTIRVRFVTSWATSEKEVDRLVDVLSHLKKIND